MAFKWSEMSIEEQTQFALDWESQPQTQWNLVRQIQSTSEVLDVLYEIAGLRTTIAVYQEREGASFDVSHIQTSELNPPLFELKLADTDGVVQSDPRHAGAWWGLLGLNADTPDVDPGEHPVRMPPNASTFMAAFQHLTTTARGSGRAGHEFAPETMIAFVNAQRVAGGSGALAHMAITLNHLVHFNADDLLHKYLLALRGHGVDEPGGRHHHHLADLVAEQSDVDNQLTRTLVTDSFFTILDRFPQIFSDTGRNSDSWPLKVSLHLNRWKVSTGNHRRALQWLERRVNRATTSWADTARTATRLRGSRERERVISESVTDKITRLRRNVQTVRQELTQARSMTTSAERIAALTSARTRVRGWRTRRGESTTEGRTDTDSTETTLEGEVGGDLWVVDLSADLSRKSIDTLERHISTVIDVENETSGSTSDTTSTTTTSRLGQHWTAMLQRTRAVEREVTREVSRQREYSQSIRRVIAILDVEQQVINVHEGITRYMAD